MARQRHQLGASHLSAESGPVGGRSPSFAGTASFRVAVDDVDELYEELRAAGVLHYADRDAPVATDYGTREFATTDIDSNLITFFRRMRPRR